jgi:HPt (histidine-containing phosphotransfer) domain-containing protein
MGARRTTPQKQFSVSIPGLDVARGIERFGSWETFKDILRSYVSNTRPLLETLREVNKDNLENYAITVHGIKGASQGIGAEGVGTLAAVLENASKFGDFDLVSKHNPSLLKALSTLLSGIDAALAEADAENQKPKRDMPDRETLAELRYACKNYDMDGVDAAMEKITGYEYESDGGLVAWLRENVEQKNLAEIAERLS